VLLAHGGGAIMSLRGRLRRAHSFQPQAQARLSEPFDQSLKRFYFDTITHDADVLRALVDYAGVDHILLGSDYPFDMGVERPAEIVRALALPAEDEALILGGNAARLLGIASDKMTR
jgi:aminocarboxymuconate-semialdehyde decarboxylase